MSPISERLITRFDYDDIRRRRIANYQQLARELAGTADLSTSGPTCASARTRGPPLCRCFQARRRRLSALLPVLVPNKTERLTRCADAAST
jgi:hypothetical protein